MDDVTKKLIAEEVQKEFVRQLEKIEKTKDVSKIFSFLGFMGPFEVQNPLFEPIKPKRLKEE